MTDPPLTEFQVDVARLFFTLPAAFEFVLGGGAALVAAGLTARPTRDLDFFVAGGLVIDARDQLEEVAAARGWTAERIPTGAPTRRNPKPQGSLGVSSSELLISRGWERDARCRCTPRTPTPGWRRLA